MRFVFLLVVACVAAGIRAERRDHRNEYLRQPWTNRWWVVSL